MSENLTEIEEKVEWLQKRIAGSIQKVHIRAKGNQRKATLIKIMLLILSASATILLGLEIQGLEAIFKKLAFVFTAIITMTSTIEPFFNFRGLWIEHERAEYKFHLLEDDIIYYVKGTPPCNYSNEKIGEFQKRFQDIWSEVSESWLDQRQSQRYNI